MGNAYILAKWQIHLCLHWEVSKGIAIVDYVGMPCQKKKGIITVRKIKLALTIDAL